MRTVPQMAELLKWLSNEQSLKWEAWIAALASYLVVRRSDEQKQVGDEWIHLFTSTFRDCWVAPDKLSELDELCDRLESLRNSPRYRIRFSDQLQSSINFLAKDGQRSKLNSLADYIWKSTDDFMLGVRAMAEVIGETAPVMWFASTPDGKKLVFRAATEEEAAARLDILKDRKRVPAPRKVLVKMAVKRIADTINDFKRHNQIEQEYLDNRKQFEAHNPGRQYYNVREARMLVIPDINSLAAIDDILALRKTINFVSYGAIALKELVGRPQFDDSVMRDAWDIIIARTIHEA